MGVRTIAVEFGDDTFLSVEVHSPESVTLKFENPHDPDKSLAFIMTDEEAITLSNALLEAAEKSREPTDD